MMKRLAGLALAGAMIAGCTSDDWAAISEGVARGLADTSYSRGYTGSYYSPYGFPNYSGWPNSFTYGDYVGPWGCRRTGSFYTCDSNGDGYADMYGNTSDGSYASSNLRVNGRGQAFTWDSACGCWQRNPAFDGPRRRYRDNYRDY